MFFKRLSLTTKGLKLAIFLKRNGIPSKGIIVEEKNNNILETVIEAKVVVSSDLNKVPINIPSIIKKVVTKNNIKKVVNIEDAIFVSKNIEEIIKNINN